MKFTVINEAFQCLNCKAKAPKHPTSCRNHCPSCLYSMHVDAHYPGDRASTCHGLMKPVGFLQSGKKGWMILHQCLLCGHQMKNTAADDDNREILIALSTKPL